MVVIELEHPIRNQRRIWHLNMDTKDQQKPVDLSRIIITNSRLVKNQVHMSCTRRSELKKRTQQKLKEKSTMLTRGNVRQGLRKMLLKLPESISLRKRFVMKKKLRQMLEIESLREEWQKESTLLKPKRRPWLSKEKLMMNK